MRKLSGLAMTIAGVVVAAPLLVASPADEAAIRQARAVMNKGFADHNIEAMTAFMTDTLTFSGPAWRLVGKQQLSETHKRFWEQRPDVTWEYNPSEIVAFEAWKWLSERGLWHQKWTAADGVTELRGTYQSFWKRVNGKWMLDAHLFVTTSCAPAERAFCKQTR